MGGTNIVFILYMNSLLILNIVYNSPIFSDYFMFWFILDFDFPLLNYRTTHS